MFTLSDTAEKNNTAVLSALSVRENVDRIPFFTLSGLYELILHSLPGIKKAEKSIGVIERRRPAVIGKFCIINQNVNHISWSVKNICILILSLSLLLPAFSSCYRNHEENPQKNANLETPAVLSLYNTLLSEPEVSEIQAARLMDIYCRRYLASGKPPLKDVEDFLLRNASSSSMGNGFVTLVRSGILSDFTAELDIRKNAENKSQENLFRHAELIYQVSKIRQTGADNPETWKQTVALMEEARGLSATYKHNDYLADCYAKLGMFDKEFLIRSYIYLDEGDSVQPLRQVRKAYRKSSLNQSFKKELNVSADAIQADILKRVPQAQNIRLKNLQLYDENGRPVDFDFSSDDDFLDGRILALAVFSKTCGYCRNELRVLSGMQKKYDNSVYIAGLLKPNVNTEIPQADLKVYKEKNEIKLPLFSIGERPEELSSVDISKVPVMFLFDNSGYLLYTIRFLKIDNLENKISWFFEDAIN